MSRTADNIHIPLKAEDAILAFMKVKPTADMPRPGKHRQKSVWAQVDEELHGPPPKKSRAKKKLK
jgi:hypothetical protein